MIGRVLGSYRIVRELGRGGMGRVYLAEHTLLGRQAAIKVLLPQASTNRELVARFFNEARAATAIRHLGIVEVYDFGHDDDGAAYLVMEYLRGDSLTRRLGRGRLDPPQALTVIRQIAAPLAAAHRAGIVHRDLKPDNVFIVADDEAAGGERVKLLDFGVAKLSAELAGGDQTQSGVIVGTPTYMAPEQCRGVAVDHRADLYALGCILYRMLVGAAPFTGDGVGDILTGHVHLPAPRPSAEVPGLDPAVDELVVKLLAKRPEDRPRSAEELMRAIDAILGPPREPSSVATGAARAPESTPVSAPEADATAADATVNGKRGVVTPGVGTPGEASGDDGTVGAASRDDRKGRGDAGDDRTAAARPAARGAWLKVAAGAGAAIVVAVVAIVVAGSGGAASARRGPLITVLDGVQYWPQAARTPHEAQHVAGARGIDGLLPAPQAAPTPPPAPPGEVAVRIDSVPAGADVLIDGVLAGRTPLVTSRPRGDVALLVDVALAGHRVERLALVPDAPIDRRVELQPAPRPRVNARGEPIGGPPSTP